MRTDQPSTGVRQARAVASVPVAPQQETAADEIHVWLAKQAIWLHLAADRLCGGEAVGERLISDSIDVLLGTTSGRTYERPYTVALSSYDLCSSEDLSRLLSLEDVTGVNRIRAGSALVFGSEPLTIVYGGNGAGKSGYVRLLKIAAGRARIGTVLPNVFEAAPGPVSWSVRAECGGNPTSFDFGGGAQHDALRSIQVFDEDLAEDYRINDRELTFEPPVLRLFDDLVRLSDSMAVELDARKARMPSRMPVAPEDFRPEAQAAVLGRIRSFRGEEEISHACRLGPDDERQLADLTRKSEMGRSPEAIERQRRRATACQELAGSAAKLYGHCSQESQQGFKTLRAEVQKARLAHKAAVDLASGASALEGFGADAWRALWIAAKEYSESAAYPGDDFPFLAEGALCVLCQQQLSDEARSRMGHFDSFVQGAASAALRKAEGGLRVALEGLPDARAVEALFASIGQIEGLPVADGAIEEAQASAVACLDATRAAGPVVAPCAALRDVGTALAKMHETLREELRVATSPEEVAAREALQKSLRSLRARKWLSEQEPGIIAEWRRAQQVRRLDDIRARCNTSEITIQKARLSERLVTGKVVQRFGEELAALKANRLPVAFQKSKGRKGRVLHRTAVAGATRPASPNEILSEEERRVLALAAFLADTTTASSAAPFVFDDPVSSLDHSYEAAVAARLAALAKTRQVIVFTHRLSFAFMVEAAGKKRGMAVNKFAIRSDAASAGLQGDFPTDKDPKTLANVIIAECPKLRKEVEGLSDSDTRLRLLGAFAAMRRAVERAVEKVLLVEIVKRFDPAIHTDNGLKHLTKITASDCALIERLMGAYSLEIHDQADELDNAPMDIDGLERDAKELVAWIEEFKKRSV